MLSGRAEACALPLESFRRGPRLRVDSARKSEIENYGERSRLDAAPRIRRCAAAALGKCAHIPSMEN